MMKAEKIEKHMARRTVVVAQNGYYSHWDVLGVMGGSSPMSLIVYGLANGKRDHWMHQACNIRKATDAECAQFFAWLVSDGRDIADGFARFGGAPRGFEAWRAGQTPAPEPVADEPTPEPVVTPRHKVGDLRVWLRSNGIGAVARITASKGSVVAFAEYKAYNADDVFDPTPENVARLVEQQRERGIVPELGDLVFVARHVPSSNSVGIVAWGDDEWDFGKIVINAVANDPDPKDRCAYALRLEEYDAHTLVIRRCPFRGVKDV
jgi:hypothetical protein